jgi:hypothetical protein
MQFYYLEDVNFEALQFSCLSLYVHLNYHLFAPSANPKVDVRQNILHGNAKILKQEK